MLQWTVPDGGLYLWCRLAGRLQGVAACRRRRCAESMAFVRGEAFYVDQAGERELRICFSSVPPNRADDVAKRLMRAIAAAKRDAGRPAVAIVCVAIGSECTALVSSWRRACAGSRRR